MVLLKKFLLLFLLVPIMFTLVRAQQLRVTVNAGEYDRVHSIIRVAYHGKISQKLLVAENRLTKKKSDVQIIDDTTLLFILPDTLLRGTHATYDIKSIKGEAFSTIRFQQDTAGIWALNGTKRVFRYNTAQMKPPPDSPAIYSRSGFIHPVYSPSGKLLTDDFPAGHAHQHGILMAWTNTTWRGQHHDFWNQHLKKGNVGHAGNFMIREGNVFGQIETRLHHFVDDSIDVIDEKWTMDIYATPAFFVFDIQSEQKNISADTLFLNKYHYGGVSFRGSKEWNKDDRQHFKNRWKILTDSGFTAETGNGKHAGFVMAGGEIDEGFAGIGVISFPANYRYPQAIRIHPIMPYWCFSPVADGSFFIAPGQTYTSKYRYVSYDTPTGEETIRAIQNDLIHPPIISILR